jgi:UTP--glucose-1-phosphate uridylyltransferase
MPLIDLAVVPVAGRGTRLLPLTKSQPKEMLPVGEKPVVQYVAEELAQSGIARLVFVTGPGKSAIENHFSIDDELITLLREGGHEDLLAKLAFSFERKKLEYFYTYQHRQLGLGHAVLCARPIVDRKQPFVVALGDSIIGLHAKSSIVRRMSEIFVREAADAVIAFETVPAEDVVQYGIAAPGRDLGDSFELTGLIEKPAAREAPSRLAVAARYVFHPDLFDYLERVRPGKGGEIQLTDAIGAMIADGRRVLGVALASDERRYDIGNFQSYFRAFFDFVLNDPQFGPALRAHALDALGRPPGDDA